MTAGNKTSWALLAAVVIILGVTGCSSGSASRSSTPAAQTPISPSECATLSEVFTKINNLLQLNGSGAKTNGATSYDLGAIKIDTLQGLKHSDDDTAEINGIVSNLINDIDQTRIDLHANNDLGLDTSNLQSDQKNVSELSCSPAPAP